MQARSVSLHHAIFDMMSAFVYLQAAVQLHTRELDACMYGLTYSLAPADTGRITEDDAQYM